MWFLDLLFFSILQIWYVEVPVSRNIPESHLDFEITRVDILFSLILFSIHSTFF